MRKRAAKPGFTLLEVVLAVTLALVLMAAMFTFYKQSSDVRASLSEEAQTVGAERAVMGLITNELRSALVNRLAGLGLEGGIDRMRFATTTLPGASVWVVQNVMSGPPAPPEQDVHIVGYRLRIVEDEQGQLYVAGLDRTCQKLLTAPAAEEGKEIRVSLLTPRLRFLRLRYWDGNAWVDSWGGGDLPGAVEVVLGIEPLPDGVDPVDYPYPMFRRVVYVPGGVRATGGTIVLGIGEEGGP